MAKFKLPKLKVNKEEAKMIKERKTQGPDRWERSLSIPANDKMVKNMEVDDEITVVLKGRVKAVRIAKGDDFDDTNFNIEITEVETDQTDSDDIGGLIDEED